MTPEWEQDARAYEAGRAAILCMFCGEAPAAWVITSDGIEHDTCATCRRDIFDGPDQVEPYTARPITEADLLDAAAYAAEQRRERV